MWCCRWADRVLCEFFAQGDQERAAGLAIRCGGRRRCFGVRHLRGSGLGASCSCPLTAEPAAAATATAANRLPLLPPSSSCVPPPHPHPCIPAHRTPAAPQPHV